MSLARQLNLAFYELKEELSYLDSGTVFVHIRNNSIGKFGIKHNPIEEQEMGQLGRGLDEDQWGYFRKIAVKSLQLKKYWTHGEILYDFAIRNNSLRTSVQFESNYNMSNLIPSGKN